jgi:hypothetical protein
MLCEARVDAVSSLRHETAFPSLWLHFVVQNDGSGDTAKDVEVVVTRVRSADGVLLQVPTRPLKWSERDREKANMPPGNRARVDIAHVLWPPNPQTGWYPPWPPSAGARTTVALVLAFYPRDAFDSRPVLDPGSYMLELSITARDVPTQYYNAKLVLRGRDGVWDHAEDPSALVDLDADGVLRASDASILEVHGPSRGQLTD